MKKVIFILSATLLLSSCGRIDRWWAGTFGHSVMCVDGVEYIQFVSGVTVKYNPNGTISTCN